MNRVFNILDKLLEYMVFIILASMSAVVAANVFCRFVLHFSLSWGDELAQILLVWLAFLGAALAMRDKSHYAFDYLVRVLPGTAKKILILASEVVAISMAAGLFYWGIKVTVLIRYWIMPAMGISRSFVYVACPVGSFFIVMYGVRNFLRELRSEVKIAGVTEDTAL